MTHTFVHELRRGDDAALVPGSRAEADGGGARAPVLVGLVLADLLNRPRHAYLPVCRNKPVQHGSRPRIGRQLAALPGAAKRTNEKPKQRSTA
jgi:hypothetical protein